MIMSCWMVYPTETAQPLDEGAGRSEREFQKPVVGTE